MLNQNVKINQYMSMIPALRRLRQKDHCLGYIVRHFKKKKKNQSQAPVAHTCNPSYLGGRDQEDQGSKPAWANSLRDPISKILVTKQCW
jgi:hypothetical protein